MRGSSIGWRKKVNCDAGPIKPQWTWRAALEGITASWSAPCQVEMPIPLDPHLSQWLDVGCPRKGMIWGKGALCSSNRLWKSSHLEPFVKELEWITWLPPAVISVKYHLYIWYVWIQMEFKYSRKSWHTGISISFSWWTSSQYPWRKNQGRLPLYY